MSDEETERRVEVLRKQVHEWRVWSISWMERLGIMTGRAGAEEARKSLDVALAVVEEIGNNSMDLGRAAEVLIKKFGNDHVSLKSEITLALVSALARGVLKARKQAVIEALSSEGRCTDPLCPVHGVGVNGPGGAKA